MIVATRPGILLLIVAGWTIWSMALVALYAVLSVGCELRWDETDLGPISLQRFVLVLIWLASVGALAWLSRITWVRLKSPGSPSTELGRFNLWIVAAGSIAACAATFWMGLPILGASTCT
jgi:hypothetical protein